MKMPKTIYGFPVEINFECEPNTVYFMQANTEATKYKFVFSNLVNITKETKKQLKLMIKNCYVKLQK